MPARKSRTLQWFLLLVCLILGTLLGIWLQYYQVTSSLFRDITQFAVDVKQVDLIVCDFGFHFALRLNLGTLLGALLGLWFFR